VCSCVRALYVSHLPLSRSASVPLLIQMNRYLFVLAVPVIFHYPLVIQIYRTRFNCSLSRLHPSCVYYRTGKFCGGIVLFSLSFFLFPFSRVDFTAGDAASPGVVAEFDSFRFESEHFN